MVGDNDVQSHSPGTLDFGQAGNPAIYGDHKSNALLTEVLQCRGSQTVTLGQAVRDVRDYGAAEC